MVEGYITVSLPKYLIQKIDEIIEVTSLGYKSRPEFVKDAVRRLLEDYEVSILDTENREK